MARQQRSPTKTHSAEIPEALIFVPLVDSLKDAASIDRASERPEASEATEAAEATEASVLIVGGMEVIVENLYAVR